MDFRRRKPSRWESWWDWFVYRSGWVEAAIIALFIAVVLGAALAFGQPTTRGEALKRRAYKTYSTITLNVDPTGSDATSCTGTGAAACATLGGALGKLPDNICHAVTINLAAGTYTGSTAAGFSFCRPPGSTTAGSITISGPTTTVAATIATGSTSGTLTAYSAFAAGVATTATDGAQGWTTDNLKGFFLEMTSGAASGQRRLIFSNTATAVRLVSSFTVAPSAGDSYEIRIPAATLTTATTATVLALASDAGGVSGTFAMNRINVLGPSNVSFVSILSAPTVNMTDCRFVNSGSSVNGTAITATSSSSIAGTYFEGGTAGVRYTRASSGGVTLFSATNANYIKGAPGAGLFLQGEGNISLSGVVETTGDVAALRVEAGAAVVTSTSGLRVLCPTGHTVTGLAMDSSTEGGSIVSVPTPHGLNVNGQLVVEKCAIAIGIGRWGYLAFAAASGLSIFNATTGLKVFKGGQVDLSSMAPLYSTVTNEIELDGVVYTQAALDAATVLSNPTYATFLTR